MNLFLRALALISTLWASPVGAQDLSALARLDPSRSAISDGWFNSYEVVLHLSQGVPFRVFTLDGPPRLVVDFREVDFRGLDVEALLADQTLASDIRVGRFQPGWSRLIADLRVSALPVEINMATQSDTGQATLSIALDRADPDAFAAQAGAPEGVPWPKEPTPSVGPALSDDRFVVVIDPGHGGIDPGAERKGVSEKELMMSFARSLREALLRASDAEVVLTREEDVFVSLTQRVAIAHKAGGDLFVSLHADALSQGGARGATVYLLSDEASDAATAQLAARHNRADIIAGADLTGSDDEVAGILLDLARQETEPRSASLANALIDGMSAAGGPMNRRPLRRAGFSVLKSADIPSVLVEVGFLSSERDLKNLLNPAWRAGMVDGLVQGILTWRDADAALKPLVRQ